MGFVLGGSTVLSGSHFGSLNAITEHLNSWTVETDGLRSACLLKAKSKFPFGQQANSGMCQKCCSSTRFPFRMNDGSPAVHKS